MDAVLRTPLQPRPEPEVEVEDIEAVVDDDLASEEVCLQDVHPEHVAPDLHLLHQEATTRALGDGHGGVPHHQAARRQHLRQAAEQHLHVLLVLRDGRRAVPGTMNVFV